MKYLLMSFTLLLMGCYSNPDRDYLDTIPKTNNATFIRDSGGMPNMPAMPNMGPGPEMQ